MKKCVSLQKRTEWKYVALAAIFKYTEVKEITGSKRVVKGKNYFDTELWFYSKDSEEIL
jgi:predicted patatin/cPLA2 family phospholipase